MATSIPRGETEALAVAREGAQTRAPGCPVLGSGAPGGEALSGCSSLPQSGTRGGRRRLEVNIRVCLD